MSQFCIQDLNFEKDIGANSLYLTIGPFKIVVDAGMDPKNFGNKALPNFNHIQKDSIDFILLSHCHLDHLGGLPVLLKAQNKAKVLVSYPTSLIAPLMLENSYTVMLRQKAEQTIPEYPLYNKDDIEQTKKRFQIFQFAQSQYFQKDDKTLIVTFFQAGHVLGASSILLEYEGKRLFITGDILFQNQKTLKGAHVPFVEDLDVLVLETTRGRTQRLADRVNEEQRLLNVIRNTLERQGVCLIPAFALGRIQELLSVLHHAYKQNLLPECPIYCSGLGMALISTFDELGKTCPSVIFDKKIIKQLHIKSLRRRKIGPESKLQGPAIYLLSSGMLVEHTPSYKVASCLLDDAKNTICFVGYCDPSTPGGQLLNTEADSIFNFKSLNFSTPVRAKIEHFDLSGHADREDLYNFAIEQSPKKIVLTHGDNEARQWFEKQFQQHPSLTILNPEVGKLYAL